MKSTRTVPTSEIERWAGLGASRIIPNFDKPGYSTVQFESTDAAYKATVRRLLDEMETV